MRQKKRVLSVALIVSMVAVLLAMLGVAYAYVPGADVYSSWTTSTPPTIDGTMTAGEWSDATVNNLTYKDLSLVLPDKSVTIYAKNDASNLYLAFVVPDLSQENWDYQFIIFDDGLNGGDGVMTDGNEDAAEIFVGGAGPPNSLDYDDWFWDFSGGPWWDFDTNVGGTRDGAGSWGHDGSQYVFEFSKPLNSADPQDLQAGPGDSVGMALDSYDVSGVTSWLWPLASSLEDDPDTWGQLHLGAPAGATSAPVFPSLYVGIAAAFGAAVLAFVVRRRFVRQQ